MNGYGRFHVRHRRARLVAALLAWSVLGSLLALLLPGCSSSAVGGRRVEALVTADGSFEVARLTRLVLAIDGDADTRVNTDVPLGAGFGNGITFTYGVQGGTTLVLAAVGLDAAGARVASGVADPVVVLSTTVPLVPITLSTSGRIDAGVARDLRGNMVDL